MKISFTVDGDFYDDREHIETLLNGGRYRSIIDELDAWLRDREKYQNEKTILVEEVRKFIREMLTNE